MNKSKKVKSESGKPDSDLVRLDYGRAAKLINVYTKALFLSYFSDETVDPRIRSKIDALHPPIDRMLLKTLWRFEPSYTKCWKELHDKGWSKIETEDYLKAIKLISKVTNGRLWKIEAGWEGYE